MNPSDSWQQVLRTNFTQIEPLADFLELDEEQRKKLLKRPSFPLNLPRRLALKIEKGRLDDPILRQFLPLIDEEQEVPGFTSDPVGDLRARRAPRLLKKYCQRALMLPTSACAMHCRYCFRREFDYAELPHQFDEELAAIAADTSLSEIILSGGDPLSLPDRTLIPLIEALSAIPHLNRLRFHTRFVIGIPERITDPLLNALATSRLQVWFVIHCNHRLELDDEVAAQLKRIAKLGIPLLNHTVLLKGVNDNLETLIELCERLVNCGIQPYYLNQLDRVSGAAHFEVDRERGLELIGGLELALSGYAVPKYAEEIAGEGSKKRVTSCRAS